MDMKLEVLLLPVSDVDRAKAFYEKLGFHLDIDHVANDDFRIIVHSSPFGSFDHLREGGTSAQPGSIDSIVLAVDDIETARDELISRGIDVSKVFHYAGFPFNISMENHRVSGRDPEGRTYFTFASFEDPDGNRWLLQEVKTRLPGREWT